MIQSIFYAIMLSFISLSAQALDSKAIELQADASLKELYHSIEGMPKGSMADRLNWFSKQFLGQEYILGSLGEGPKALFDQYPLYRIDGFDCDTFVNTVLALALSNNLNSFQQCINTIRYKKGKVSYIHRNHFTSVDWNLNNQKLGILKDITLNIRDKNKQIVALYAKTLINKPSWYAHKNSSTIRLLSAKKQLNEKRLDQLKKLGARLEIVQSKVPYLPFSALFPDQNTADFYLFSQIPNGAIIEIVRPNWDLQKQIGTSLNISHLGFAFWEKNTLFFRQASSQYKKIVDVPLIEYLYEARSSPTIKGINVQVVIPQEPGHC